MIALRQTTACGGVTPKGSAVPTVKFAVAIRGDGRRSRGGIPEGPKPIAGGERSEPPVGREKRVEPWKGDRRNLSPFQGSVTCGADPGFASLTRGYWLAPLRGASRSHPLCGWRLTFAIASQASLLAVTILSHILSNVLFPGKAGEKGNQ